MNIKRIGIDLAKQVFQIHGVDGQEKAVLRKQLRRAQPVRDGLFNPSQTFEVRRNVRFATTPKVYTPTCLGAKVLGMNLNERA